MAIEIVDFPLKMVVFHSFSLPEGNQLDMLFSTQVLDSIYGSIPIQFGLHDDFQHLIMTIDFPC